MILTLTNAARWAATILCLLVLSASSSLSAANVKGQVIDSSTKEVMSFVNVKVCRTGTELPIKGAPTDEQGNFNLSGIAVGSYDLVVSMVGYEKIVRAIRINTASQTLDLKQIEMEAEDEILDEVEVRGQRSQMKFEIDKKVFNVGADLSSAGESASEVLSNIPSVEVDNEGEISLRGNSGVTIWINGKESGLTADNRAQILEQLPAESIERIEVITNPSARFSSEGTTGIINIILKEDRRAGYFGSVQANGSTDGRAQLGATINYSSPKWDINGSLGYRRFERKGGSLSEVNYTGDSTYLNSRSDNEGYHNGLFARGGATYHFDKKNEVSFSGFTMLGGGNNETDINYDGTARKSLRQSNSDNDMRMYNIELGYKHSWTDDHYLDFIASHSRFTGDGKNDFEETYTHPVRPSQYQRQEGEGKSTEYEIQLDYSNKLSDTYKIEAGYKVEFEREDEPTKTFAGSSPGDAAAEYNLWNRFMYNEDVHAAYATFSGMAWEKLGYQIGLRGEYTHRKAQSNDWRTNPGTETYGAERKKGFFDLFPSAFITYNIGMGNEIQLNYSRRIRRPWGGQLNDFVNITDSTNISTGNPNLMPEYGNSYEVNYIKTWEAGHSLSLSLYGRTTEDVIQRVTSLKEINANKVRYSTSVNIGNTQSFGLELVGKVKFAKWLDLTPSFNLYQYSLDEFTYDSVTYESRNQLNWSARAILNAMLPSDWNLQVRGNYNARQAMAQGSRKAMYSMDAGVKKSFFNKQLAMALNVRDILDSRRFKSTISGQGFEQYSESWQRGRSLALTLTWNFGNMKPTKPKQRPNGEMQGGEEGGDGGEGGGFGIGGGM